MLAARHDDDDDDDIPQASKSGVGNNSVRTNYSNFEYFNIFLVKSSI